jgi:hypothetical protein
MTRWLAYGASLVLTFAMISPAGAQLPGGGSHIGVGRSPGRDDPAMREVGSALELRMANGVNVIVSHAKDLQLTGEQLTRVVAIKRRLDSLNTAPMRELDSLERSRREPSRIAIPRSRGDKPAEPDPRLEETLDILRANIREGESDAYEVLSGTQLQRALQLVKEARTNAALVVGHDQPPK